jgi:hypothetical protein
MSKNAKLLFINQLGSITTKNRFINKYFYFWGQLI